MFAVCSLACLFVFVGLLKLGLLVFCRVSFCLADLPVSVSAFAGTAASTPSENQLPPVSVQALWIVCLRIFVCMCVCVCPCVCVYVCVCLCMCSCRCACVILML